MGFEQVIRGGKRSGITGNTGFRLRMREVSCPSPVLENRGCHSRAFVTGCWKLQEGVNRGVPRPERGVGGDLHEGPQEAPSYKVLERESPRGGGGGNRIQATVVRTLAELARAKNLPERARGKSFPRTERKSMENYRSWPPHSMENVGRGTPKKEAARSNGEEKEKTLLHRGEVKASNTNSAGRHGF